MALTCKTSLINLQIGDYVWCKYYTVTSGEIGMFSDIATKTDAEVSGLTLPTNPGATASGYFKLICVGEDYLGRKKLIADRNLQHSISWDKLNSLGIISGKSFDLQGSIIPPMTSSSAPSGIVSANGHFSGYENYRAFDWNINSHYISYGITPCWIRYQFQTPKTIIKYTLASCYSVNNSPKNWTFEGSNNGTDWTILDTRTNVTGWSNEKKVFTFDNNTTYLYYRINVTEVGLSGNRLSISEIGMLDSIIPFNSYIRLMTGGISSTDTDNEWNNIIVSSTLNGNITAGDNNVWNWQYNTGTWCSETLPSANTRRCSRGGTASVSGFYDDANSVSSVASAYRSFRPLVLLEYTPSNKLLIQDGTTLYSVVSGTRSVVGSAPVTETMFQDYGMYDLSEVQHSHISDLTSPKILLFKV